MTDLSRHPGHTEALFRDANEAIREGVWPDGEATVVRFRCECARTDCNLPVELTPEAYEAVRQDPRRFVVLPGHEMPEAEDVVETHDGYLVVEKRGGAAEIAEATDPRDGEAPGD